MCAHVLVAEDDPKQAELVRRYLEHEGHRVVVVHDGRAALEEARRRPPDLMVLDVMMPKVDGLDVCRVLRAETGTAALPLLVLTARSAEDDLLLALDLGADDYMTKPYSPRELMARVRTLLRRSGAAASAGVAAAAPPDPVLRVGALTVDPVRHEVTVEGRRIECTPGEFDLLSLLAAEPGRVFTRAQIIERQHGIDRYFTSRTVDVHVMNLRRKIEPRPQRPVRLVTVYGVGYKLAAEPPTPRAPAAEPGPHRAR
ncbi:response regulator transcription factor [Peterkaempfera griseoplana]|uniref:response regulator transcription factor n=1 Tax=Peterkaempfera griseoplana TaxID=66896 RepID=UPI0006E4668A|nr:response regulator transcription factor [Peterkaempfera griseoplana]